jgi:EAL domain-containing protein (putative c-di-GMP-specific phosphodiesterase class I)
VPQFTIRRQPVDFQPVVSGRFTGKPIVTAVIAMAHSLKLRVVAEGVESMEELTFLRSLKCDEAQGHYFSPPATAHQFARFLKVGSASPGRANLALRVAS